MVAALNARNGGGALKLMLARNAELVAALHIL